jgi:rhodanese-related sulfurtransferase
MPISVTPAEAARLVREEGAVLVDIREPDEQARERIPGAHAMPLSRLNAVPLPEGRPLVFLCRSGARTAAEAARLAARAGEAGGVMLLQGGLQAWKRAGLPVQADPRQPIEMVRQVHIAAGALVLMGVLLGTFLAPGFYALAGFVGAGLVFAGATGFCGMAHLLRRMPWNRALGQAA